MGLCTVSVCVTLCGSNENFIPPSVGFMRSDLSELPPTINSRFETKKNGQTTLHHRMSGKCVKSKWLDVNSKFCKNQDRNINKAALLQRILNTMSCSLTPEQRHGEEQPQPFRNSRIDFYSGHKHWSLFCLTFCRYYLRGTPTGAAQWGLCSWHYCGCMLLMDHQLLGYLAREMGFQQKKKSVNSPLTELRFKFWSQWDMKVIPPLYG